ncbi:hypothetical protein [Mycobacterium sp. NPDC050853]|uniref:hypothetical protein n=1 Tax=Mycobacterium sp. NPDC050853 TaxID=3155160 RepID=UPI0033ECBFEB
MMLQPVWTPADFDATVAAAALQESVSVSGARHRRILDGTTASLPTIRETRGRKYRGQHRATRFRLSVADLQICGAP